MGVSRVDFGGETLIDLTNDTVNEQSLLKGYTAHGANGESVEGDVIIPKKISQLENDSKFITETGDSSKTTVTFEQAVKRANVNSGDDLSTAFSKLSKFCNDLKPHAFSSPSSDLLTTVLGFSLDATMGKKLKDLHDANKNEINALSGNLSNMNRIGAPVAYENIEMLHTSRYCKVGNLAAITVKFTAKQDIDAYSGILSNIPHSAFWSLCYARESGTGEWRKMYVWGTSLSCHEKLYAGREYDLSVAYVNTI